MKSRLKGQPKPPGQPQAESPGASPVNLLLGACALVIALHAAGTAWPSHLAWGVHLFAFYPPAVGWIALLVSLSLLVPAVRAAVGEWLDLVVKKLSALPVVVINAALVAAMLYLGYRFAAELHLLGDGAILMRSIPKSTWGDTVISSFRNQPLLNVIYKWAMNADPTGPNTHPKEVYTTIDMIAAAMMVLLVSWFTGKLGRPPVERALLGLFVFAGAGSQFFFGYVENYVLQYVATIAYAMTGWLAMERRMHVAVPLVIMAILPGFNLGTLILLPSGLFLLLWRYRDKWAKGAAILAVLAVAGAGVLYLVGYDFGRFISKFVGGKNVDFLPFFSVPDGNFPYAMFSGRHLLDWFNAHGLVVPFGLFIALILIPTLRKEDRWGNPAFVFLVLLAACGLAFTWIVNSALGMARDWDMLSSYFIPLAVLDVYLLVKSPSLEPRRPVLVAVTMLSLLHLGGFIGVNADAGRHLARMRSLGDERLLSKATQMTYDEALANYFFDSGRYAEARVYYEHYMTIDSFNTRIIGNISDVYRKLGDKENYFIQLQRGVKLGSPNPGMYSNLGVEFSSRGDTAQAFFWNLKAVEVDSLHPSGNANLGILYMGRKEYAKSDFHFARAIAAGMREPKLFLYAAESAVLSKHYALALKHYESYLERAPDDQRARQQRDRLKVILQEEGAKR